MLHMWGYIHFEASSTCGTKTQLFKWTCLLNTTRYY